MTKAMITAFCFIGYAFFCCMTFAVSYSKLRREGYYESSAGFYSFLLAFFWPFVWFYLSALLASYPITAAIKKLEKRKS